MVAHSFGDIISGDTAEPEVVVAASPSVGGLFDSLTGSIGITSRPKPVAAPVASSSSPAGSALAGAAASDAPKSGLLDKDLLRNFIATAMPFGSSTSPLSLNCFVVVLSSSSLTSLLNQFCRYTIRPQPF